MAGDQRGRGRDDPREERCDLDSGAVPVPRRRGRRDDRPLDVRVEFVVLDGDAGKALARRQAAVMRQVLQWFQDHPDSVEDDVSGTGQTG